MMSRGGLGGLTVWGLVVCCSWWVFLYEQAEGAMVTNFTVYSKTSNDSGDNTVTIKKGELLHAVCVAFDLTDVPLITLYSGDKRLSNHDVLTSHPSPHETKVEVTFRLLNCRDTWKLSCQAYIKAHQLVDKKTMSVVCVSLKRTRSLEDDMRLEARNTTEYPTHGDNLTTPRGNPTQTTTEYHTQTTTDYHTQTTTDYPTQTTTDYPTQTTTDYPTQTTTDYPTQTTTDSPTQTTTEYPTQITTDYPTQTTTEYPTQTTTDSPIQITTDSPTQTTTEYHTQTTTDYPTQTTTDYPTQITTDYPTQTTTDYPTQTTTDYPTTQDDVTPTSATYTSKSTIKMAPTTVKKPVDCPHRKGFLYPLEDSCTGYKSCNSGVFTSHKCRGDKVFSRIVGACVGFNSILDVCSGNHPNASCASHPSHKGFLVSIPHPSDCSKYYVCQMDSGGRPKVVSCPHLYSFDVKARLCKPKPETFCGFGRK